jgi:hypothetical protein
MLQHFLLKQIRHAALMRDRAGPLAIAPRPTFGGIISVYDSAKVTYYRHPPPDLTPNFDVAIH